MSAPEPDVLGIAQPQSLAPEPESAAPGPREVVDTHGEARGLALAPLLVLEPLTAFLDAQGLGTGPLEVERIGAGHSNVTYAARRGGERFVLRRPPRPPLPPSAHDVLREARVLRALEGTEVRTPRVLAASDDETILGVPFYLMEYVDGHVLGSDELPAELSPIAERGRVGRELVDALADLHAIDPESVGLDGFGRPSGYLERQLRRFGQLWERGRTRELPRMDALGEWLAANLPDSPRATIVHGDYRLGNVMYGLDAPARLVAIFDWEMATLGDPLADLGYLAATYPRPGEPTNPMTELSLATLQEGFPEREELFARYAERTGMPVGDLSWYQVLALWKAAVFLEQSYGRFLAGTTDDPFFATLDRGVPELVEAADAITRGSATGGV